MYGSVMVVLRLVAPVVSTRRRPRLTLDSSCRLCWRWVVKVTHLFIYLLSFDRNVVSASLTTQIPAPSSATATCVSGKGMQASFLRFYRPPY